MKTYISLFTLLGNSCSRPESSPYTRKKTDRAIASLKIDCSEHVKKVASKGHLYHEIENIRRLPQKLTKGDDKMILNSMVWNNHKKPVFVYLVKTRKNSDPYLYAYLVEEKAKNFCHITNILPISLEEEIDLNEIKLTE